MKNAEASVTLDFGALVADLRLQVERHLEELFSDLPDTEMARLAEYVALDGGHRWRAIATIATGMLFCDEPVERLLPTACAIELAHAASLLVDDLPSMDNAEIRRCRPCAHRVFPPWAVDMGAVFMITLAYKLILEHEAVDVPSRLQAARLLSEAGLGMIAGQELDVLGRRAGKVASRSILECHQLKTGALFSAATAAAAIQCGAAPEKVETVRTFGECMGLAYQLLDDLAEVEFDSDTLGKRPDPQADLTSAVRLLGAAETDRIGRSSQARAVALLAGFGDEAEPLRELARRISL